MNQLHNNNPSVMVKRKNDRLKRLHKAYNKICVMSAIIASSTSSALAVTKPAGVNTGSMNKLINIVFYILYAGCAIYAGAAAFSIAKGHNEEDPRTMKSGIVGVVIAGIVAGSLVAIKQAVFS